MTIEASVLEPLHPSGMTADPPAPSDREAESRPITILERIGRRLVAAVRSRLAADGAAIELIDAWDPSAHRAGLGPGFRHANRAHAAPTTVDERHAIRVVVDNPAFYAAAALGGGLGIAESYIDGHWHADDLPALIELLASRRDAMRSLDGFAARLLAPAGRLAYRLQRNSRRGSRRNIAAHYDLGDEFFRLFLDDSLTYSCAIFENGAESLAEAQREKIDRACRKLRLGPKDHLLEIGSGWGALALHAASRYGCRVTTTTISERQHEACARRVREAGLVDRVRVLKSDYRDLRGSFTRLVSIEMIEAVGAERLGDYLATCSSLLTRDGMALIQAIVINDQSFRAAAKRRDFLKKHVFPGSCLPSVAAISDALRDRTDLRLWHLEDIGPHYARTLALWREAFHARLAGVRALGFDDRFIRTWDYYFAYCEGTFRSRFCGDVQLLLVKPDARPEPPADPGAEPPVCSVTTQDRAIHALPPRTRPTERAASESHVPVVLR